MTLRYLKWQKMTTIQMTKKCYFGYSNNYSVFSFSIFTKNQNVYYYSLESLWLLSAPWYDLHKRIYLRRRNTQRHRYGKTDLHQLPARWPPDYCSNLSSPIERQFQRLSNILCFFKWVLNKNDKYYSLFLIWKKRVCISNRL